MCGICGYADFAHRRTDRHVLENMTLALKHRGPDEEGYFEEEHISFGHRRLKVIDLEGGRQPMTGQDGRVTVVFNGEIYNFQEIRKELEQKGRVFRSRSDTESLLQLYEAKGTQAFRELDGMFAVAIYDRDIKTLYLAVDPFGKKPLYYYTRGSQILFSSEIRSLLKHPSVPREIDRQGLAEFLAFEYIPAPRTIIKDVQKLEGGTFLEWGSQVSRKVAYKPATACKPSRGEDGDPDVLITSLKQSIKRRLVSDVPLGVFLSGGLDSSALVSLIRELYPSRPIKTFNIGFDEASFDESRYAKKVSLTFDTEHITEKCSLAQMCKEHDRILGELDEPLADASFIPTYMLCRLARKHVTVALSGDGGDELFLGYPTFQADEWARRLANWPPFLVKGLDALSGKLPVSLKNLSPDFKLKQFFKGFYHPEFSRQQIWLGAFDPEEMARVLQKDLKAYAAKAHEIFRDTSFTQATDALERTRDFYFRFYLQGDILVKADRASMANSLEVRSPLLDDHFVRTMRSIPARTHMKGGRLKALFKKAMHNRLPKDIIHRNKKGFGIPISQWIRKDLKGEFEKAFSKKNLSQHPFFDYEEVQSIFKEHLSGRKDNRKRLWTLYVFLKWKAKNL